MARAAVVAAAAACLLVACSSGPQEPGPHDLERFDVKTKATITVDEDGFSPAQLTITAGDVIEVVNEGADAHDAIGGDRFDTGKIEPGDTVALVMTKPGTIRYHDRFAADHKATLTVRPDPNADDEDA
jgi:plastocyanin